MGSQTLELLHCRCWMVRPDLYDSRLCIQGVTCHIAAMLKHMAMPAAPAAYSILSLLALMFPGTPIVSPLYTQMSTDVTSDHFISGEGFLWEIRSSSSSQMHCSTRWSCQ
jgi:hypothetical protein